MPIIFLLSLAHAAPWPVDIDAPLPQAPTQIAVYATLPALPEARLLNLEDAFGLRGATAWDPVIARAHVEDDGQFLYAYADGGIAFHDTSADLEAPMQVRDADAVWNDADAILDQLGLFDASPFDLSADRIFRSQATITTPDGQSHGPRTTSQMARYVATLDGYPVFGPGGETTVEFDDSGMIAVSDAQRDLELVALLHPDSAQAAVERWMARAETEHRWSMYRAYLHDIERVRIVSVQLGYFAPSSGELCPTIEPVYQIQGFVIGHDHLGQKTAVDLLWWEPVRADRTIPNLHILPDPTLK